MVSLNGRYVGSEGSRPMPLQFDASGFIVDPCTWTKETSRQIAEMDGIGPLARDHWQFIFHLRYRYLLGCTLLGVRRISEDCEAQDRIRKLFGSCRQAWRVAGLPDPGEEVKALMA